ncbi:PCNA-interacting partner-like [Mizuhopecten yessoensis]|uniref:PCNA-interacting partner n=1 Tax=Mizuhopecten yessoensis TaxID=6573 RepID=A0A210PUT1_MIZYE|nr:PCNA-interacting partner-like [Mizuhopecten yessoensis]OWF40206.1 PCNA-interacting partner [Mizuhopecten yessoensis]
MVMDNKVAYFLNSCDADTISKYINCLKTKIFAKRSNSDTETRSCVVVDCGSGHEGTVNLAQYYMSLCRKYGLLPNERTTLLSSVDQIIALQLCLAEKNKQGNGEFEVETSTVIQANKDIVKHKLSLVKSAQECAGQSRLPSMETDEVYPVGDEIKQEYQAFLKHCNYIDMCEVLLAVCEACHSNQSLQAELSVTDIIIIGLPRNQTERAMVEYLCEGRLTKNITLEVSLEIDEGTDVKEDDINVLYSDVTIQEALGESGADKSFFQPTPASGQPRSLTESYIQLVYGSYLELLVNSRAELALARSLNTPERELTHQAFTDIKHASQAKNMTMYQTAVSYVMKIRLGGKGYAPDPNSPLAQHVKGLGEFVSLIHKLQTVIEEETDKRVSCRKVLNIIKKEIIKCRENRLRISNVESVCEKLQKEVVRVINMFESSVSSSPDKAVRDGGSAVGRHTLKVLRYIVDKLVSGMDDFKVQTLDFLCDGFSSQRTPVHFPCIMSQFRSPDEYLDSPDDPYNKSLSDRLLSQRSSETPIHQKRYKSCMAWANPTHNEDIKGQNIILTQSEVTLVPSKTIVHPGKHTNQELGVANRIAETINDQENVPSTAIEVKEVSGQGQDESKVNKAKVNKTTKVTKKIPVKGQKRPLVSGDSPPRANKKTKTESKTCRRKLLPQVKGQQQLTKFFRV